MRVVRARAAVMKLAQNAGMEVPDATRKVAAQNYHHQPMPVGKAADVPGGDSRCIVLKNMFDRLSDEAQQPNYYTELADDVRGECAKHGTVLFVGADKCAPLAAARGCHGATALVRVSPERSERVGEARVD